MPLRSAWEGYLRLNLISVPVKAYTANVSGGGTVAFHQLHAECHSRIRYKKVCPIHGEVSNDEIVSGYEHAKGQYVVVKKDELQKLRPESDKTIDIDIFIDAGDLDPVYYSGRTYYLVPDGRNAAKSYAVIGRVMSDAGRVAIAAMVITSREHLVLVRPIGRLLAASVLSYADAVKPPTTFEEEVPDASVSAKELELAGGLIEAATAKKFDFTKYENRYADKVRKLLHGKAAKKGLKRPAAPEDEEPAIINLMDALRQSLQQVKGKPRSRAATTRAARRPRRKSG